MEIRYDHKIYLITLLYTISLIPLYFILFKIPIPYLQPWMVFIFPLILPICLITKKKIRDKVRECDDLYLNSIKDQKLKELYIEDAKIWYEKTFVQKKNKIINLSLLLGFLVIPSLIRFITSQNFAINLTITELIYLAISGLSLIAILIYASYYFFFLFQISSIVHHYSFWETNHTQDKNPLGELFILNIFAYLLLDSVFVTYFTPLFISMMVYFISGTNPKINYLNNITNGFIKYKKAVPYVIMFANLMYILKWVHGSFSSIDLLLFFFWFFDILYF